MEFRVIGFGVLCKILFQQYYLKNMVLWIINYYLPCQIIDEEF